MYCKKCGNLLTPGDTVCKNCGEPVTPVTEQNVPGMNQMGMDPNAVGMAAQNNLNQPEMMNMQSNVPNDQVGLNNMAQPMDNSNVNNYNPQPMDAQQVNPQPINPQGMGMNPQQPMDMNQNMPQTSDPIGSQSNVNLQNGNKKSPFILIAIILGIIIVILVGVVVFKALSGDDNSNVNDNNPSTNTETSTENQNDNGNVSSVTNSNKGEYKGFEFEVPSGYVFSVEDGYLQLVNNSTLVAVMGQVLSYQNVAAIEANTQEFITELKNAGYTVISNNKKTYGGAEWYLFEVQLQGKDLTFGFVNLGENFLLELCIYNAGGKVIDDQIFNELTSMVKSATYYGSSEFSNSGESASKVTFDFANNIDKKLK